MGPPPHFEPGKLTAGNAALLAALAVPLLVAIFLNSNKKKMKQRGVPARVGSEEQDGVTMRNNRFLALLDTPWEEATTIAALFEQASSQFAQNRALGSRTLIKAEIEMSKEGQQLQKLTLGDYVWLTYEEAFHRVCSFSSGLVGVGLRKEEKVALFAETRAEWMIGLQGCFRQSFTVVTVYASLGEDALAHSLNETEVGTVICDNKQLQKLLKLGSQLKTVKRVICMDEQNGSGAPNGWDVLSFSSVQRLGEVHPVDCHLPEPDDIAVIMYTSGSTGMPKGVLMSHSNVVATVAGVLNCVPDLSSTDVYLAYLPLAHVLELIAESIMIASGAAIGYGSPLTLTDTSSKIKTGTKGDVTELKPTLMAAVPAVLDRVRDAVRKKVDAKGGSAKMLFELAYRRRLAAIEGSWLGAWGLERLLWDALVFGKIHAALGGRVRGILSGAAPLSHDTQRFFKICFGAPIGQAYGLTETCAGGTFSEWDDESVGRVGPPLPSCYVKLVNWEAGGYKTTDKPFPRGEIVIGGPSVTMGYFKNQAKTNEDFKVDKLGMRWFYTGDIGQFHEDGCLEIIDRKKDIVKLQHGEYISLGKVEAALSASPFVENIMIHADPFHSYAVALVVPSRAAFENWAQEVGIPHSSFPELCEKKEAEQEVLKSVEQAARQAKLSRVEIPSRVKLLPEPWTPESGLATAALKLKRENIRKVFAEELKQLYA